MGFSRSEIHALARAVDFLHHTTFDMYEGRPCPDTGLICMDWGREPKWEHLSQQNKVEVLNRYIDWTDFQPQQVDRLIENIAADKERVQWFDGVEMSDSAARGVREWIEFEKMPEEEQLREAARSMKRSKTLGGNGVMVHAKWEEMNDRQRYEVIRNELWLRENPDMPHHRRDEILQEELGCSSREPLTPQEKRLTSPSEIGRSSGPSPLPSPERNGGRER